MRLFTWEFPKLRMRRSQSPGFARTAVRPPDCFVVLQSLHAHPYLSHALVAPEAGLAGPERGQREQAGNGAKGKYFPLDEDPSLLGKERNVLWSVCRSQAIEEMEVNFSREKI